jgi:hypothetical protein
MGRLKKDHGGYRPSGLWLKYQQPVAVEEPARHRGKKNTRRWCKGKVGTEHALVRRFKHYGWSSRRSRFIYTVCTVCRKEFYKIRHEGIPLEIEIDESNESVVYPVQVKVNGIVLPIDYRKYQDDRYYCSACDEWHFNN